MNTLTITYALLGGIIPALLWLFFWLRKDSKRPEPKGRLAETFLAGMIAVPLVIPLQKMVGDAWPILGFMSFFLWAVIEEGFKFGVAYFSAIRTRDDDEPVDSLVYMVTAALGFAALENALFIWHPLIEDNVSLAFVTGGMRFFGASLLHVIASGAIGVGLGLAFYKSRLTKIVCGLLGLIFAVGFHTAFNLFILNSNDITTWQGFGFVWISVIALLITFEKIEQIAPPK